MKKLVLALIVLWSSSAYSQSSPAWLTLPNAPVVGRHNDAYFVSPEMGWIVNGDGDIFGTNDGGDSWELQFHQGTAHFRAVGFADASKGWAGNVGEGEFGATDTTAIYQTLDGGTTWTPQVEFEGPVPKGICGLNVVNDSTIVGVGRVRGPSFFVKSTDGGQTWTSKDMSAHAAGLIDVYFFTPDHGIAVGLTNSFHPESSGVVLATTDGGETWEKRITTSRTGEWAWKISFPSDQVGYVSLQRNSESPIYFLKTVDGGATWEEKILFQSYYFVQGMGFITETMGWAGGNSTFFTLQTLDGGESWFSAGFGARVNRFRFLGDSLAYAVGRSVYKYTAETSVGLEEDIGPFVHQRSILHPSYPNPFHQNTTISYSLSGEEPVELSIFELTGRLIKVLVRARQPPGVHNAYWDGRDELGRDVPDGVYFYTLKTGNTSITRKMIALR